MECPRPYPIVLLSRTKHKFDGALEIFGGRLPFLVLLTPYANSANSGVCILSKRWTVDWTFVYMDKHSGLGKNQENSGGNLDLHRQDWSHVGALYNANVKSFRTFS